MSTLQTLVEGYIKPSRSKGVVRNQDAYDQCLEFTISELERLLNMYRTTVYLEDMRARLIRDSIDHHIRRYHGYAIEGRIGSHYRESGVVENDSIFEHVVPASSVRDMLIEERLTINQALNTPVCLLKKSSDTILTKNGLSKTSPSNYYFFRRYEVLNASFTTHDGAEVSNLLNWSLQNHFDHFGVK
jgi:hypothetical protein